MPIARCINSECLAIFLAPVEWTPFAAFCPCCRQEIYEQAKANFEFERIDDDSPSDA